MSIRNHSHYSLQVSISKPEDIVRVCKESGYNFAGITDITSVSGCVKFIKTCKENKIKPLIGSDIRLSDGGYITLICRNIQGWKELLVVISKANSQNDKLEPHISFDDILSNITPSNFVCIDGYVESRLFSKIFSDTTCVMSAHSSEECMKCANNLFDISSYLDKMRGIFEDSYFIEIDNLSEETFFLPELCRDIILPHSRPDEVIPSTSSFYLNKRDAIDHRVILCSKLKTTLKQLKEKISESGDVGLHKFLNTSRYHILHREVLEQGYEEQETNCLQRIADLCEEFDILSKPKLPKFVCPNGMTQNEYLKHLCREGWRKTIGLESLTQEQIIVYRDRVLAELDVIESVNLAGYFLIVQDYVNEFKNKGYLIGPGRGCFLPDTRVKLPNGNLSCISSLDINDVVLDAYSNPQIVENVIVYDINEEIVELEMENGRIIRCTKDHKFLTANGWKRAENLTQEDDIIEV